MPTENKVWSELARTKAMLTGEQNSTLATHLLQVLGIVLQRENARAILRRSQKFIDCDFRDLLDAEVICNTPFDSH